MKKQSQKSAATSPNVLRFTPAKVVPLHWINCEHIDRPGARVFALVITTAGQELIETSLAASPQVRIIFRVERGETDGITGWRFIAEPEIPNDADERRVVPVDFHA